MAYDLGPPLQDPPHPSASLNLTHQELLPPDYGSGLPGRNSANWLPKDISETLVDLSQGPAQPELAAGEPARGLSP